MRGSLRRFALAFVLALAMVPAMAASALAADQTINQVEVNFDTDVVQLNTSLTEKQVMAALRGTHQSVGEHYTSEASYLSYYESSLKCWNGVGSGTSMMSTTKDYAFDYALSIRDSGYVWPDSVLACTSYQPTHLASDCPDFAIIVNGVPRTDVGVRMVGDSLRLYVPVGHATSDPIISGIAIDGGDISVERGSTHTFFASLTGTAPDGDIVWSVTGNTSSNTKISASGELSVGLDEAASTVKVSAASHFNPKIIDTRTITITEAPPTIDSVRIFPNGATVAAGDTFSFAATVTGTQTDKSVAWTVSGGCADTTIGMNGKAAELSVSPDETADYVYVTATSLADSSKSDTVTVRISKKVEVARIDIAVDPSTFGFDEAITEGEVSSRIGYGTKNMTGFSLKSDGLVYYKTDQSCWYGIGDGSSMVSSEKRYGISYTVKAADGYKFPAELRAFTSYQPTHTVSECSNFKVYVNGALCSSAGIRYMDEGVLRLEVPFDEVEVIDNVSATSNVGSLFFKGGKAVDANFNVVAGSKVDVVEHGWVAYDHSGVSYFCGPQHEFTNDVYRYYVYLVAKDDGAILAKNAKLVVDGVEWESAYDDDDFGADAQGHYFLSPKMMLCDHVSTTEVEKDLVPASIDADGVAHDGSYTQLTVCSSCGEIMGSETVTIPSVITDSIFATENYAYSGKVISPVFNVVDCDTNELIEGVDYDVALSGARKLVGAYAATVTFKGHYSGTLQQSFYVVPKTTYITKLTRGKKYFKAYWSKRTTQTSGYQIRYSTKSDMSSAKTKTISGTKYTSKKVTSLKAKKKYYVQVRTYKTVSGVKYYSNWSKVKSVTTK